MTDRVYISLTLSYHNLLYINNVHPSTRKLVFHKANEESHPSFLIKKSVSDGILQ